MKARIYQLYQLLKGLLVNRYWRFWFGAFGKKSWIFGRIVVNHPENISIGQNTTINDGVKLNALDKIIVGDFVHISYDSVLTTGGLRLYQDYKSRKHFKDQIIVENGVWIGAGAIIMPGVTLREGCVVGAGSVVTKSTRPFTVVAGVPAKVISKIPA